MSARDENALEPVEPIKQSGAVLRVGRAMLTSGTGSDPVKTATDQVAHGFGLDQHEAHVTLTEITGPPTAVPSSGQRSPRFTPSGTAVTLIAEKIVASFASCPIGESTRLGRTLRQWKATYLGSFTTERSNNGGTEAINGLIELQAHRQRLPQPRQLPTPHAPARR